MAIKERLLTNLVDVATFGPSFVLRHFGRLRSNKVVKISVPGLGAMHIRAGESDVAALRQVFGERQYDISWPTELKSRIEAAYRRIVASGGTPIIVDAGANIGAATLFFGLRYPEAAIVSVEPDPGNAEILRKNTAHRRKHFLMEAAVGAEPGFVELTSDENGLGWAIRTQRSARGVPVVTVEDAFRASTGDTPFIVKIDIEGFESDLFSTNTGWIDQCHAIFIEPHDWMLPGQRTSQNFQKAMASRDFEVFVYGECLLYARV